MHCDVVCVHVVPRHVQELVLILPAERLLLELLSLRWRGRRVGDFGDKVRCRGFCETVDEHSHERDLDEDVEAQAEAEENASAVFEPQFLLVFVVTDAGEVGFEL